MPLPALSRGILALGVTSLALPAVLAQPRQVVKAPEAQAWVDVATFGGVGMPMGMPMPGAGGGNPMVLLDGLLGGGGRAANSFGQTQAMSPGRWVDVTLHTRRNAQLEAAQQTVPPGFLSPALQLQSPPPEAAKPPPDPGDERTGMDMPQAAGADATDAADAAPATPAEPAKPAENKKPGVKDVLRGLFGR